MKTMLKTRRNLVFLCCLALTFLPVVVKSNMNLYLPKPEVKDLFGVNDMQMYYIRNGVLNKNAISFKPHVQANKDTQHFVWKAMLPDNSVLYELSFPPFRTASDLSDLKNDEHDTGNYIETPQASITMNGKLPNKEENFTVFLRCTGEREGQVTVPIVFKFRLSDNPTEEIIVELQRLKKCKKVDKKPTTDVDIDGNYHGDSTSNKKKNASKPIDDNQAFPGAMNPDTFNTVDHSRSQSTDAFYISISVVTAIIIISVIVVRVWHAKASKRPENAEAESCMMSMNSNVHHPNQFLRQDLPNNATAQHHWPGSNSSWMHFTPIINDLGTDITEICSKLSGIAVPLSDVILEEILQEGTFSKIYRGTLEGSISVLVKTVTSAASEEQTRLLLFESILLRGMHHRNILSIKNVVLDGPDPPLVLFPYTKGGNLKRYLRDIKFTDMANISTLSSNRKNYEQASTQDLVEMGIHIACGMTYLAKRGLVHKDIATRNCVIDSDLKVKITDNALSRDLFPADYCCLGDNENRPVRWLAMESLVHKVYSTASDVWSFGVLLWELQSLAAMPYNDIDDFEMSIYLQDGFRLSQPINCPDHLYNIMARCWHFSSDKRPTFSQLLQMLTEFYAELGEYV